MSYDLMVFDPASVPAGRVDFMRWYDGQTEWGESHGYDDPAVSSAVLREWFMEMIQTFPAMNGPYATDDVDDPSVTDYSVGRSAIYAAFAWSQAEHAYDFMFKLAGKHRLGFFEVSSEKGAVWLPDEKGQLVCAHTG